MVAFILLLVLGGCKPPGPDMVGLSPESGNASGHLFINSANKSEIIFGESATPPAGFEPADGATLSIDVLGFSAPTGAGGAFILRGVPTGIYELKATLGSAETTRTLTIFADLVVQLEATVFTREQALAQVLESEGLEADQPGTYQIIGPSHPVPSNAIIEESFSAAAREEKQLTTLASPQWLFFVNPSLQLRFGHEVYYYLVDATSGQLSKVVASAWPQINGYVYYHLIEKNQTLGDLALAPESLNIPEVAPTPMQVVEAPPLESKHHVAGCEVPTTYALLIMGNDESASVADMDRMRGVLEAGAFGNNVVISEYRPPNATPLAQIRNQWLQLCALAKPCDTMFVYVSAHGKGSGVFMYKQTEILSGLRIAFQGGEYETLSNGDQSFPLDTCLACHYVFIFDHCYAGAWLRQTNPKQLVPRLRNKLGTYATVLASCNQQKEAGSYPTFSAGITGSVFTTALESNLNAFAVGNPDYSVFPGGTGSVTLNNVFTNTAFDVSRSADERIAAQGPVPFYRVPEEDEPPCFVPDVEEGEGSFVQPEGEGEVEGETDGEGPLEGEGSAQEGEGTNASTTGCSVILRFSQGTSGCGSVSDYEGVYHVRVTDSDILFSYFFGGDMRGTLGTVGTFEANGMSGDNVTTLSGSFDATACSGSGQYSITTAGCTSTWQVEIGCAEQRETPTTTLGHVQFLFEQIGGAEFAETALANAVTLPTNITRPWQSEAAATTYPSGLVEMTHRVQAIKNLTIEEATTLFNRSTNTPGIFSCLTESDSFTLCPPGSDTLSAGPWLFLATVVQENIPVSDFSETLRYRVVFESDDDPLNDYLQAPEYPSDTYRGTDRWYQLGYLPSSGWRFAVNRWDGTRTVAASSAARAIVEGNVFLLAVPLSEFPSSNPEFRLVSELLSTDCLPRSTDFDSELPNLTSLFEP